VGFGTPLSLVIGLILITGGLTLFFLGNFKPEIKRDSDNVYAVLGIIAGILGVISFNKDIVPSIEQMLLSGMCIFLMWENIQKREPMALPPRRDDDRGRRPYRAEYDDAGSSYSGNAGGRFGGDDRGGRGLPRRDYDDRPGPGSPDRGGTDRYLRPDEPRSGRDLGRESGREGSREPGSRRNRDVDEPRPSRATWDDEPPRTIPERSSRSDRQADRPARPARGNDDFGAPEGGDVDRPRRRKPEESGDRPARRRERTGSSDRPSREDIPAADFVDFPPPKKDTGSSWGPQD
jgi:hypothetical protein